MVEEQMRLPGFVQRQTLEDRHCYHTLSGCHSRGKCAGSHHEAVMPPNTRLFVVVFYEAGGGKVSSDYFS